MEVLLPFLAEDLHLYTIRGALWQASRERALAQTLKSVTLVRITNVYGGRKRFVKNLSQNRQTKP